MFHIAATFAGFANRKRIGYFMVSLMLQYLILLTCTPLLIFILHIAATRVFMRFKFDIPNQVIVIICSFVGHIPIAAALWMVYLRYLTTPVELVWTVIYGFILYNILAYCYFHIFNMSDTARRVRILYEIYNSKQLKESDIASLYSANNMLDSRLERFLSMKQIKFSDGRYLLNRKFFYYVAKIVAWWGCILGFPPPQMAYDKSKK
jgi:hypothetical protein